MESWMVYRTLTIHRRSGVISLVSQFKTRPIRRSAPCFVHRTLSPVLSYLPASRCVHDEQMSSCGVSDAAAVKSPVSVATTWNNAVTLLVARFSSIRAVARKTQ